MPPAVTVPAPPVNTALVTDAAYAGTMLSAPRATTEPVTVAMTRRRRPLPTCGPGVRLLRRAAPVPPIDSNMLEEPSVCTGKPPDELPRARRYEPRCPDTPELDSEVPRNGVQRPKRPA